MSIKVMFSLRSHTYLIISIFMSTLSDIYVLYIYIYKTTLIYGTIPKYENIEVIFEYPHMHTFNIFLAPSRNL